MPKFIAAFIVAVLVPFTFAAPAEAFRPVPGYKYPDLCKNIKGEQTFPDFQFRRVAYNTETQRPNDCIVLYRGR